MARPRAPLGIRYVYAEPAGGASARLALGVLQLDRLAALRGTDAIRFSRQPPVAAPTAAHGAQHCVARRRRPRHVRRVGRAGYAAAAGDTPSSAGSVWSEGAARVRPLGFHD